MSSTACAAIETHLELYAAGECDEPTRLLVEKHLASCLTCLHVYHQAGRLIHGLDWQLRREGRLREAETRFAVRERSARRRRTWLWAGAVAASLFLLLGLSWKALYGPPELAKTNQGTGNGQGRYAKHELPGGTTLWAAPNTRWQLLGERKVALTDGALFVKVGHAPAAPADAPPIEIITPAGVATAHGTEFTVEVAPAVPLVTPKGEVEMHAGKKAVFVLILTGIVHLSNPLGEITGKDGEALSAQEQTAPQKHVENLALHFATHYKPVSVTVQPKIPAYALPLDLHKIANFQAVARELKLADAEPLLRAQGFAVLRGKGNEDIVAPYEDLKDREIPIVITADTLLHLYHVQFAETLKALEERVFLPDLVALTGALVAELQRLPLPPGDERFQAARLKALTYVAIAHKALQPDATLPKEIDPESVAQILARMKEAAGYWPTPPQDAARQWSLFRYSEDFSQYRPRGHYTRSEPLKRYFTAMMWLGRMAFLLKGDASHGADDQPALVSVEEARQQTLAAVLLTRVLDQTQLPDKRKAQAVWERIYRATSFYAGLADDLGPQHYRLALLKVCGPDLDWRLLADDARFAALRAELSKYPAPAIYNGIGGLRTLNPEAGPEKRLQMLHKATGFRFMGQRFTPDTYMMAKLVHPVVGRPSRDGLFTRVETDGGPVRGFPRGLDVMAVLGSNRARDLLRELGDDAYEAGPKTLSYPQAFQEVKREYDALSPTDWNRNLYWSWLHTLKPLLTSYGSGYPTFMTTTAYQNKSLNTALASWTELRHDTLLAVKQSDIGGVGGLPAQMEPVHGYVEPVPELYARLLALVRMTHKGLAGMDLLDDPARQRLTDLEQIIERLLRISEKELANEVLTRQDYEFIRDFGDKLKDTITRPDPAKLAALEKEFQRAKQAGDRKVQEDAWARMVEEAKGKEEALETTMVADVHSEPNSKRVLTEATGYVDLGLFVYRQPDGRLVLGAGPVLSYYEFTHPIHDRLTDESWRARLQRNDVPARPEWTNLYLARKGNYTFPQ